MTENKKAFFTVSYRIFKKLLHLPEDTQILKVYDDPEIHNQFRVTVEHSDLYIVEEGNIIPRVSPSLIFDWGK